jgi:hypothetical protein
MKEFVEFPKMARLSREIIVTEKIDGTNAQVCVVELDGYPAPGSVWESDGLAIFAGSRTRWITPDSDNFGFAAWVRDNAEELALLGPGSHFGEWWGAGIQRRYGLDHKRFSLFNVDRWGDDAARPSCCHVVPALYRGPFDTAAIDDTLDKLARYGSVCAPGFMKPEGVVVYHTAARTGFKKTIEKDEVPKTMSA